MKIEKIATLVFFGSGVISGVISNFFVDSQNFFLSIVIPIVIYFGCLLPFKNLVKEKRLKVILDTLITFVLFWLLVWFTLYGL